MTKPHKTLSERVELATSAETRTTSATGGEKGTKAQRYDLIPVEALKTVAELYGRGAAKYDEHNWRRGYEWSKSYAAMMRHANAFWGGEDYDEEMGVPHMTCVIFHAMTLITFMEEQRKYDDRFEKDQALEELKSRLSGVTASHIDESIGVREATKEEIETFDKNIRRKPDGSPVTLCHCGVMVVAQTESDVPSHMNASLAMNYCQDCCLVRLS